MEPDFKKLAQMFKGHKTIGIGQVDCDQARGSCSKMGVNGFPAIKAVVNGKGKSYNGQRAAEDMKRFIEKLDANRGSGGGSAKCRSGMFKSKVKHAVVPLCESHFPDHKAKNDWLIYFYDHTATAEDRDALNKLALTLGNNAPEANAKTKKANEKKKRDRIQGLAVEHDIKVKLPAKGPFGFDEIAKIGAVCCDCDDDHKAFCSTALRQGEETLSTPQYFWVSAGKRELVDLGEKTDKDLVNLVFQKQGMLPKVMGKRKASGKSESEL